MAPISVEALYASELKPVYSFLYRLGARGTDIEDVAHDVFVTAMKRLDSYDRSRPLRPWVLGIAFRTMSEHRRRQASDSTPGDDDALERQADESATAHDRLEAKQAQQLVELALATLPDERRQVFVMHDLEGLIAADIAELIGCPLQTVYSRLRVARTEFTQAVRRIQLKRGEA